MLISAFTYGSICNLNEVGSLLNLSLGFSNHRFYWKLIASMPVDSGNEVICGAHYK